MHQGRTSSHLCLVEFQPFPFALDVLGHRGLSCSTEQLAHSCLGPFVGLLIVGVSSAVTVPGPGYLDVIFPHRVIRHLPVSSVVRVMGFAAVISSCPSPLGATLNTQNYSSFLIDRFLSWLTILP